MFTGLRSAQARREVDRLRGVGVLELSKSKRGSLVPAFPAWLAAWLLPHLDLR